MGEQGSRGEEQGGEEEGRGRRRGGGWSGWVCGWGGVGVGGGKGEEERRGGGSAWVRGWVGGGVTIIFVDKHYGSRVPVDTALTCGYDDVSLHAATRSST